MIRYEVIIYSDASPDGHRDWVGVPTSEGASERPRSPRLQSGERHWSHEDQAFIVEVPELPGCMADGRTYQEALANVEVISQEWIETAKEVGRLIPQPQGRLVFA